MKLIFTDVRFSNENIKSVTFPLYIKNLKVQLQLIQSSNGAFGTLKLLLSRMKW